jgi:peptide/nickel transport system ATP-binding protein
VSDTPLLDIQQLRTYFHSDEGTVKAVDDVSFSIRPGETLGLVGESGSGKSVTSLTIMRLLPAASAEIAGGTVSLLGRNLATLSQRQMCDIRGQDAAMIFQEPMTSLNPVFRVGDQVAEAILAHQSVTNAEAMKRTVQLFREVGIPDPELRVRSYPHEMSGGQKQRVMIAMALACNPKLLIADEPTTALDVTIQAQILDLLRDLRDRRGMSILFITHDLGVIAEIADRVAVMYRGKIVEYGDVLQVFADPQHPYTRGLLACRPRLDTPYTILPTVDDFMETSKENGEVVIKARPMTDARLKELTHSGRGKRPVIEGDPMLKVTGLKVWFPVRQGLVGASQHVKAVDDVSFAVWPGQTLGLVGESGCGKTTTGRAILHLIKPTAGQIEFEGTDLGAAFDADANFAAITSLIRVLTGALAIAGAIASLIRFAGYGGPTGLLIATGALMLAVVGALLAFLVPMMRPRARSRRADVQIIFQDPYSSLNPRQTVEQILTEPMLVHAIGRTYADRRARAAKLLEEVGLGAEHLRRFPHEFSGGQRQRICIARALSVEPKLVICDEAVSALDVSVQAQVLNLLKRLQESRGLTYIFISHDLAVVKFMSDVMAVMQHGKILEIGPSEAIYAHPEMDYTRKLIEAIPKDDLDHIRAVRAKSGRLSATDADINMKAVARRTSTSVPTDRGAPGRTATPLTPGPAPTSNRAATDASKTIDVVFYALDAEDDTIDTGTARTVAAGLEEGDWALLSTHANADAGMVGADELEQGLSAAEADPGVSAAGRVAMGAVRAWIKAQNKPVIGVQIDKAAASPATPVMP